MAPSIWARSSGPSRVATPAAFRRGRPRSFATLDGRSRRLKVCGRGPRRASQALATAAAKDGVSRPSIRQRALAEAKSLGGRRRADLVARHRSLALQILQAHHGETGRSRAFEPRRGRSDRDVAALGWAPAKGRRPAGGWPVKKLFRHGEGDREVQGEMRDGSGRRRSVPSRVRGTARARGRACGGRPHVSGGGIASRRRRDRRRLPQSDTSWSTTCTTPAIEAAYEPPSRRQPATRVAARCECGPPTRSCRKASRRTRRPRRQRPVARGERVGGTVAAPARIVQSGVRRR